MVYRKFRKFRKTYSKKSSNRPFKKRNGSRSKNGRTIHYFKRTFKTVVALTDQSFYALPTDGTPSYNEFKLNQLPNYTDFTNLYDTYKICGIATKYIFDKNSSANDNTGDIPRLITVNDYNDTTAPANESAMLEYASFKSTRLDKVVKRYIRPTQNITESVATAETFKSRWNPTANVGISHMGLKQAIISSSNTGLVALGTLTQYITFYVACRTAK